MTARDRKERHKYELLQLIDWFYNEIGLSKYDEDNHWLFSLHKIAGYVIKHVDLDKANAQYIRNNAKRSVSAPALAFVYVTFELALTNTPFYHLMRDVWRLILEMLPAQRKRRERKLEDLIREIGRLEAEVARYKLAMLHYI